MFILVGRLFGGILTFGHFLGVWNCWGREASLRDFLRREGIFFWGSFSEKVLEEFLRLVWLSLFSLFCTKLGRMD